MFKKILLVLGIIVVLFAGVNTAAALNSSVFDAISGLPLSDQIIFIAREVECLKADSLIREAMDVSGITDADTADNFEARMDQVRAHLGENGTLWNERLVKMEDLYSRYQSARSSCTRQ